MSRRATRIKVEGISEHSISLDAAIRAAQAELKAPLDCIVIDATVSGPERYAAYPWSWAVTFAVPVKI